MENSEAEKVELTSCGYCGGRLSAGSVQAAFWGDEGMVAIKDVPAHLCERCGEQFYDEETTAIIHSLLDNRKREIAACEEIVVPVYSFPAIWESLVDHQAIQPASEEE